jgi:hypothetical protein
VLAELPPPSSRLRLQALAALCATVGGLAAMGLMLAGLWIVGFVVGVAITLALVGATAHRSGLPGALAFVLAYAFALGLFIWGPLFFVALALWGGWQ